MRYKLYIFITLIFLFILYNIYSNSNTTRCNVEYFSVGAQPNSGESLATPPPTPSPPSTPSPPPTPTSRLTCRNKYLNNDCSSNPQCKWNDDRKYCFHISECGYLDNDSCNDSNDRCIWNTSSSFCETKCINENDENPCCVTINENGNFETHGPSNSIYKNRSDCAQIYLESNRQYLSKLSNERDVSDHMDEGQILSNILSDTNIYSTRNKEDPEQARKDILEHNIEKDERYKKYYLRKAQEHLIDSIHQNLESSAANSETPNRFNIADSKINNFLQPAPKLDNGICAIMNASHAWFSVLSQKTGYGENIMENNNIKPIRDFYNSYNKDNSHDPIPTSIYNQNDETSLYNIIKNKVKIGDTNYLIDNPYTHYHSKDWFISDSSREADPLYEGHDYRDPDLNDGKNQYMFTDYYNDEYSSPDTVRNNKKPTALWNTLIGEDRDPAISASDCESVGGIWYSELYDNVISDVYLRRYYLRDGIWSKPSYKKKLKFTGRGGGPVSIDSDRTKSYVFNYETLNEENEINSCPNTSYYCVDSSYDYLKKNPEEQDNIDNAITRMQNIITASATKCITKDTENPCSSTYNCVAKDQSQYASDGAYAWELDPCPLKMKSYKEHREKNPLKYIGMTEDIKDKFDCEAGESNICKYDDKDTTLYDDYIKIYDDYNNCQEDETHLRQEQGNIVTATATYKHFDTGDRVLVNDSNSNYNGLSGSVYNFDVDSGYYTVVLESVERALLGEVDALVVTIPPSALVRDTAAAPPPPPTDPTQAEGFYLDFNLGDSLMVTQSDHPDYWYGYKQDNPDMKGWFPSSFTSSQTPSSCKDDLKSHLDKLFDQYPGFDKGFICRRPYKYAICADNASDCKNASFTEHANCWPSVNHGGKPWLKPINIGTEENEYKYLLSPGPNDMFSNPKYEYDEFDNRNPIKLCTIYSPDSNYYTRYIKDNPKYPNAGSENWLKEECDNSFDMFGNTCKWSNTDHKCTSASKINRNIPDLSLKHTPMDFSNGTFSYTKNPDNVIESPKYPTLSNNPNQNISNDPHDKKNKNIYPFCGNRRIINLDDHILENDKGKIKANISQRGGLYDERKEYVDDDINKYNIKCTDLNGTQFSNLGNCGHYMEALDYDSTDITQKFTPCIRDSEWEDKCNSVNLGTLPNDVSRLSRDQAVKIRTHRCEAVVDGNGSQMCDFIDQTTNKMIPHGVCVAKDAGKNKCKASDNLCLNTDNIFEALNSPDIIADEKYLLRNYYENPKCDNLDFDEQGLKVDMVDDYSKPCIRYTTVSAGGTPAVQCVEWHKKPDETQTKYKETVNAWAKNSTDVTKTTGSLPTPTHPIYVPNCQRVRPQVYTSNAHDGLEERGSDKLGHTWKETECRGYYDEYGPCEDIYQYLDPRKIEPQNDPSLIVGPFDTGGGLPLLRYHTDYQRKCQSRLNNPTCSKNTIRTRQSEIHNIENKLVETGNTIGIPKNFKKELDKKYRNPKVLKYIHSASDIGYTEDGIDYGYYTKAPLTIPILNPNVEASDIDSNGNMVVNEGNIYDDGIRYYDNDTNNFKIWEFLSTNASCSRHSNVNEGGCGKDKFCNNAGLCQSCIDAIDYRDYTRSTIGFNQFNTRDIQGENNLWDGQLGDIKAPLCLDDTGNHCIFNMGENDNASAVLPNNRPIIQASGILPSTSFNKEDCGGIKGEYSNASDCTFSPGHNIPKYAYNIVKPVFSRFGLGGGIRKCNKSWENHFKAIEDDLKKYPPAPPYVSRLDIISASNGTSALGVDSLDPTCINIEDSNVDKNKRCWVGDLDDVNYEPENMITEDFINGSRNPDNTPYNDETQCPPCRGVDQPGNNYVLASNCEKQNEHYWAPSNIRKLTELKGHDENDGIINKEAVFTCLDCPLGLVRLGDVTDNKPLWSKYCSGFRHSMDLSPPTNEEEEKIYNNCENAYVCNEDISDFNKFLDYAEYADEFIEGDIFGMDRPLLSSAADAIIDYQDPNNQIGTRELIKTVGTDIIDFGEKVMGAGSFDTIKDVFGSVTDLEKNINCEENMPGCDKKLLPKIKNFMEYVNTSGNLPSFKNWASGGSLDTDNEYNASNAALFRSAGAQTANLCGRNEKLCFKSMVVDHALHQDPPQILKNETEYNTYLKELTTEDLEKIKQSVNSVKITGIIPNLKNVFQSKSEDVSKILEDYNWGTSTQNCNGVWGPCNASCIKTYSIRNPDFTGKPCEYEDGHQMMCNRNDRTSEGTQCGDICTFKKTTCANQVDANGNLLRDDGSLICNAPDEYYLVPDGFKDNNNFKETCLYGTYSNTSEDTWDDRKDTLFKEGKHKPISHSNNADRCKDPSEMNECEKQCVPLMDTSGNYLNYKNDDISGTIKSISRCNSSGTKRIDFDIKSPYPLGKKGKKWVYNEYDFSQYNLQDINYTSGNDKSSICTIINKDPDSNVSTTTDLTSDILNLNKKFRDNYKNRYPFVNLTVPCYNNENVYDDNDNVIGTWTGDEFVPTSTVPHAPMIPGSQEPLNNCFDAYIKYENGCNNIIPPGSKKRRYGTTEPDKALKQAATEDNWKQECCVPANIPDAPMMPGSQEPLNNCYDAYTKYENGCNNIKPPGSKIRKYGTTEPEKALNHAATEVNWKRECCKNKN